MSSTPYLRYPDVHGDRIAFVAEDDVWVAPLSGGRAWRVSSLQLPARNPRFSPDGSRIAWTVIQGGAPEVVTADTDGGDFRQLTFWGSQGTRVRGFDSTGHVIATSAFEFEDSRLKWAYQVPLDGSAPNRLPYGPLDTLAEGPVLGDERPRVIGSVLTREPAHWKRYRGGTAGKLWIDADGNGEFTRLVPELDGNLAYPMWIQGRIAFFSDHEGYGNLYSVTPRGTDLRRHTDFQDFYVRHPSGDGNRIVFESAGELWLLENLEAEPVRLDIRLGSAGTGRRPRPLNAARHLKAAMPDADGKSSVVESHGTLHWLTHKDGPSRVIEATAGVRARLGRPLPGGRAVFVADPDNVEALFIKDVFASLPSGRQVPAPAAPRPAAPAPGQPELPKPVSASGRTGGGSTVPAAADAVPGGAAPDDAGGTNASGASEAVLASQDAALGTGLTRIAFDTPTRAAELVPSPDGTLVAVATEKGRLYLLDVAAGKLSLVVEEGHGAIEDLAFSSDSRWLAWAEPVAGDGARARIRIRETAGAAAPIQQVTDGRFHDHSPSFTPDGKFLAFLSERSFDPVYDTHGFDLGFPTSTKPFMVALAAATPSPFGPAAHAVEAQDPAEPADPDSPDDGGSAAPVKVDVDRLAERIIAVPVPQGRYSKLRAAEGALLWLAEDVYGVTGDGRASAADRAPGKRLERFDLAKKDVSVLVPALEDYELSGDGSTVLLRSDNRLRAVPSASRTEEDSAESITVDLTRIRVLLEPGKVWGQAFDEAWRLQRDFFWASDMGGLDWEAVHARYRPLVANLGSHDDLVDLLWELHGELGTSHAYVTPAGIAEPGAGAQGFLGADLRPGPEGWAVARILDPESSDPQAVSPLSAPGADVRPGDLITAVDGLPVPADKGPGALLVGAAGRPVELTVVRGSDGQAPERRRIAVVPLRSEERLRYQNWVNGNRRAVRSASDGRFGYLHIPDMVASGWAQLHRDLDSEAEKDALIIDVRHNRGGHTSQLVAELIGRKVTAWSLPRDGDPGTYPAQSPRGPVVILADEFAGSDGDIVTQVAKLRGIGPVIGTRTWGGVVGIDGRFALADGTGVTQPRYAYWFTGGIGFGVENRGVQPDIEVPYPPHAYAAGEDPQLEHGVGILKEMLSELPTDQPPAREGYPSLRPGPLPPRPQGTTAG